MQTAAASAASFSTYDCYAHSRIPAPQRQDRSHAFRHGRRCRAVPFRCRRGRHVGTHGDARTHIPHAICHLLPRAAARDAPVNAARMAACHTDCRMCSHIPRTAAVQSGRSSGSHDMHTRPRSNGRRRHRRHARRQRRHDGHIQPAMQYGRGSYSASSIVVHRKRGVHLRAAPRTYCAAAYNAIRRGTVLPSCPASRSRMGRRPRANIVLYVAAVAGLHHRTHDLLPA